MFQGILLVFARAKRTLDEKVRALREGPGVFGELAECDYVVPFGAALPFALIVLPRFLGSHREGGNGRAVLRVVQFGVLACETDNGELIHVHSFLISFGLICPLCCLGAPQSKRPRSQASGVLNGMVRRGLAAIVVS